METLILIFIFTVSVVGLVKGADWFLESAEKIGLFLGLSPFIVGVTIVSLGTSFPELFTGVMAVLQETPAIVAANAIGSNVAQGVLTVTHISTVTSHFKLGVGINMIGNKPHVVQLRFRKGKLQSVVEQIISVSLVRRAFCS